MAIMPYIRQRAGSLDRYSHSNPRRRQPRVGLSPSFVCLSVCLFVCLSARYLKNRCS